MEKSINKYIQQIFANINKVSYVFYQKKYMNQNYLISAH